MNSTCENCIHSHVCKLYSKAKYVASFMPTQPTFVCSEWHEAAPKQEEQLPKESV